MLEMYNEKNSSGNYHWNIIITVCTGITGGFFFDPDWLQ